MSIVDKPSNSFSFTLKWDSDVLQNDLEGLECPQLPEPFFQLHRLIERAYRALPWPSQISQIALVTEVLGGRGDISAAAKVIALMQNMCPSLNFDWVVLSFGYDPQAYLSGVLDRSKIQIRTPVPFPNEPSKVDMLIVGPVKCSWGTGYIESRSKIKLHGPRFGFLENAESVNSYSTCIAHDQLMKVESEKAYKEYHKIHPILFPSKTASAYGLAMGLQTGSGVFLDESRVNAPLSRGDCCPSYLSQIEDSHLRDDIFNALGSELDYDRYSFNSGYAHRKASWGKFIDFVAVHERDKQVVIVLNQSSLYEEHSAQSFFDTLFTPERSNSSKIGAMER
jgi:hypothetical protein